MLHSYKRLEYKRKDLMDATIKTCILTSNINREAIIRFVNSYHCTANGNTTLLTLPVYNLYSKLGTLLSYEIINSDSEENTEQLIGTIFSIILTLNLGKSSYTTFLCVHPQYRKANHALALINANINFGTKFLGVNHGYYLGNKLRNKGCLINSWYRILDVEKMKDTGFGMVVIHPEIIYAVSTTNLKVKKGLHTRNYVDNLSIIHWKPTKEELERYEQHMRFYTILEKETSLARAVFILTPLECIIGKTGAKVDMAMLTYYYSITGDEQENFNALLYSVKAAGYKCLYGYLLGSLSRKLLFDCACHITNLDLYLNFHNHYYENIDSSHINIPLF